MIETTNLTVSITAHGRSVRGIRIKLNRDTETNIWNMKTVEHIFGQIQKLIFIDFLCFMNYIKGVFIPFQP